MINYITSRQYFAYDLVQICHSNVVEDVVHHEGM